MRERKSMIRRLQVGFTYFLVLLLAYMQGIFHSPEFAVDLMFTVSIQLYMPGKPQAKRKEPSIIVLEVFFFFWTYHGSQAWLARQLKSCLFYVKKVCVIHGFATPLCCFIVSRQQATVLFKVSTDFRSDLMHSLQHISTLKKSDLDRICWTTKLTC